jgi:succinate-semialdehyde dehydrogenase/glutarate-semialdehyde dehydrogenase
MSAPTTLERPEGPLLVDAPLSYIENLRPEHGVLIGGLWRPGASGKFAVEDSATGEVIADVADADQGDAIAALDAACARPPGWAALAPRIRSELLTKVRDLMLRDAEDLARLISAENGKSLGDARAEVTYAAEFFRWYAEEAVRPQGHYGTAPAGGVRTVVTSRPVGVAVLVTPWNFPAAMATRKIAPALAAGCTVVLKPAAETPLTALAIARLLAEAGVPDGVVNVVPTRDADSIVSALLADPRVRKISFTGSTGVGRILMRKAADRMVNASMELGGTAPFIVTSDANIEAAVEGAMVAKFRNGGQACTAANCFFVHTDVYDQFVGLLSERVRALTVGPASSGADIGPLISERACAGIAQLVTAALDAGAHMAAQAGVPASNGHFFAPTVLSSVPTDSILVREEIFGPVAPVVAWQDLDDLLESLNGGEYGLASYVFAGDLQAALSIGERLDTGMVGINRGLVSDPAAPFGGTKQSGIGREGARAGIEEYLETQYFSVAW